MHSLNSESFRLTVQPVPLMMHEYSIAFHQNFSNFLERWKFDGQGCVVYIPVIINLCCPAVSLNICRYKRVVYSIRRFPLLEFLNFLSVKSPCLHFWAISVWAFFWRCQYQGHSLPSISFRRRTCTAIVSLMASWSILD